jgi:hypothetical protein
MSPGSLSPESKDPWVFFDGMRNDSTDRMRVPSNRRQLRIVVVPLERRDRSLSDPESLGHVALAEIQANAKVDEISHQICVIFSEGQRMRWEGDDKSAPMSRARGGIDRSL